MNILFFDTETTGKADQRIPVSEFEKWPRIIELAWQVASFPSGELIFDDSSYLIRPQGWEIPKEKFWIENGFDTATSLLNGRPILEILNLFLFDLQKCDLLVAHNMMFDHKVLAAEMIRAGLKSEKLLPRFCTMSTESVIKYCKVPFPGRRDHRPWINRQYKWPKLEELYFTLFGKKPEKTHKAGEDVTTCRLCFFELFKRGIIEIPITRESENA